MGKETDEEPITLPDSELLEELEPDRESSEEPGTGDLIEPTQPSPDAVDGQPQDNEADGDDSRAEDEAVSNEIPQADAPDADGNLAETEEETAEVLTDSPPPDENENDFVALDDDEIADGTDEQPAEDPPDSPVVDVDGNESAESDDDELNDLTDENPEEPEASVTAAEDKGDAAEEEEDEKEAGDEEDGEDVQSETGKAVNKNPAESDGTGRDEKKAATTANHQTGKKFAKGAFSKKALAAGLIFLMISGIILYTQSSLPGRKQKVDTGPDQKVETVPEPESQTGQSPDPVQIQTPEPASPGKYDKYLAKLEEAEQLRNALLEKKEEIYKLKMHYLMGIVELSDQISQEMQKANISSLDQALKNKHIELGLRTIQRRRAYIRELEKPDRWAHNGSEELLFLRRKTLLDLQVADIASGIDLDRHLRYINAAIQKYQPNAENLSLDNLTPKYTPIETIWSEIRQQQAEKVQTPVSPQDEKIIDEICSGDSEHIAELATMTAKAAKCLVQMNGSDLFLNGLKQLGPDEAQYLSQWQGNWICLNGIKKLSPAVARYLFKWQGSWISLNGLTEFPPELAMYLMEWKGNQLELMGLNYQQNKPDRRALKFLALWEAMGGKLYVSEGVRKQMEDVM